MNLFPLSKLYNLKTTAIFKYFFFKMWLNAFLLYWVHIFPQFKSDWRWVTALAEVWRKSLGNFNSAAVTSANRPEMKPQKDFQNLSVFSLNRFWSKKTSGTDQTFTMQILNSRFSLISACVSLERSFLPELRRFLSIVAVDFFFGYSPSSKL